MKALNFRRLEQRWRARHEDDFGAVEHIPGDHGGGKLKRFRPAKRGAIEELAGSLKDGWIERLLNHAGSFNAEDLEGSSGVFSRDVSGAFAAADGGVDLEGCGGCYELSIVLNGLHEPDKCVCSRPSHKKPSEGSRFEEVTGHAFPRSSWMASAMESP